METLKQLLIKMQNIDRRILYLLTALCLALPLIFPIGLPVYPSPPVKALFQKVEETKKIQEKENKIVIVVMDWGPSTRAENYPQCEAVVRHLMKKKIKFAGLTLVIDGKDIMREILEKCAKDYNAVYGVDYCNWGYQQGMALFIKQLARSIPGAVKTDEGGRPITSLPMMKGITDINNVSLVFEATGLVGLFNVWLNYFQGDKYKPMLGHGCTAISIPEQYNYWGAGQSVGFLGGMAGAAEYEKLNERSDKGTASMDSLTVAQLMAILLIALGNIGYYLKNKEKNKMTS